MAAERPADAAASSTQSLLAISDDVGAGAPEAAAGGLVPPPRHPVSPERDSPRLYFCVDAPLRPVAARREVWRPLLNGLFFVAMAAGGLALTYVRLSTETVSLAFGNVLFAGGLMPLVLAVWSLLLGYGLRRRDDAMRALSSAVLLATGYALIAGVARASLDGWLTDQLGPAMFEIGVLFVISRLFFLVEDDERRIQWLEGELRRAQASPAFGLALSYFYNFVLPVARNLRPPPEPTFVLTERGAERHRCQLLDPWLLVLVPRDLSGLDIKAQLAKAVGQGALTNGKVEGRTETHRPMFATVLSVNSSVGQCAGLCDVPTIVSSIWERAQRRGAGGDGDGDVDPAADPSWLGAWARRVQEVWQPLPPPTPVDVRAELVAFQNHLWQLIRDHDETRDVVKVVSIPALPLDVDALAGAATQLRAGGPASTAGVAAARLSPTG